MLNESLSFHQYKSIVLVVVVTQCKMKIFLSSMILNYWILLGESPSFHQYNAMILMVVASAWNGLRKFIVALPGPSIY